MRALVVDPGKLTGYGWLDAWGDGEVRFQGAELGHFEFLEAADQWVRPYGLFAGGLDVVVCESFTVRADTQRTVGGDRLYSAEQIGCLRYWCRRAGIPYVEQTPADMKSFDKGKAKTKLLGWWDEPRGSGFRGHRRDAASHALLYAVRQNLLDARRLIP